jgi:hypothetical protein
MTPTGNTTSTEADALHSWQTATEQLSAFAATVSASSVDDTTFQKLRGLRQAERDTWQRCRPHWSE